MTRKQFTRKHPDGKDSEGKGFQRKHSNKRQLDIAPAERKAALLSLPLQTHVDMVTLTLDNLELKLVALGALNEIQEEMSAEDIQFLRRLSERLMQQRERIERVCGGAVVCGAGVRRRMM